MLPKQLRALFYWILRSGKFGRFIADMIAWGFYFYVKIFRIPPQQDLGGLTVISHKHKFIFFGLPKVASRSFYNLFVHEKAQEYDIEWQEKRGYFFEVAARYPDYYKFSFVRNPWSRILSCYNSKVADNIIGKRARILSFYRGLKGGMPLNEFIQWLNTDEGGDRIADRHWISQHKFLCDENGQMLCDFVGRYETLDADWQKVCDYLKLGAVTLPHKGYVSAEGKTSNPAAMDKKETEPKQKTDYRAAFDEELKAMVATRYAADIEMFDYEF